MNIDGIRILCCLRRPKLPNQGEPEVDQSPDVVLDKQFIGNVLSSLGLHKLIN